MNWAPLALVILLAFAGGWVWRGAFDLWRSSRRKPVIVYGETHFNSGTNAATVTWTLPGDDMPAPKLRAVE